jgi:hypothetical protein
VDRVEVIDAEGLGRVADSLVDFVGEFFGEGVEDFGQLGGAFFAEEVVAYARCVELVGVSSCYRWGRVRWTAIQSRYHSLA